MRRDFTYEMRFGFCVNKLMRPDFRISYSAILHENGAAARPSASRSTVLECVWGGVGYKDLVLGKASRPQLAGHSGCLFQGPQIYRPLKG